MKIIIQQEDGECVIIKDMEAPKLMEFVSMFRDYISEVTLIVQDNVQWEKSQTG